MVQMRPLSVYDMVIIIFSEKLPSLPLKVKLLLIKAFAAFATVMGIRSIRHHNKHATTKLATKVTGDDLTFSFCVACLMKLTLNES